MKDAQGESESLHDCPSKESIELQLNRIVFHLLHLERIDDPHGNVTNQQERNHLPAWFGAIVFRQVNPPARHIGNEE